MKSGIYMIKNLKNGKIYIGQSVNVLRRLRDHRYLLRKNMHSNDYLQKQFNRDGFENFEFKILEYCEEECLNKKEKDWMLKFNTLDRKNGYNLELWDNEQKIVSEQSREAKRGKNNPMFGKKHSQDFVEYMKTKNRGQSNIFKESDVEFIKISLINGITQTELSLLYNVKISTINKIAKCKNWFWVRSDLNEQLINLTYDLKDKRDFEILKLWNLKYPMYKIADAVKCDRLTVKKVLEKNNILS